jgi:hypothetical protein
MRVVLIGIVAAIVIAAQDRASADFILGEPTNLGQTVNCGKADEGVAISDDGLSLYFGSVRPSGCGDFDLCVITRASAAEPWGEPTNLGPIVNSPVNDGSPCLAADGLELFFDSYRLDPEAADIWITRRTFLDDPWEDPVNLGSVVNTVDTEGGPSLSSDGCLLYFHSDRPDGSGGYDLWMASRATSADPWETPVNLGEVVNSNATDCGPSISADGRALFFYSSRSGGLGNLDLWVTIRADPSDPWGTPVNLGPSVNTGSGELNPTISADGRTLWFSACRPGGCGSSDLWEVPVVPVTDFNADGISDVIDLALMIESWGMNDPLYDIGPMPWGDGIVDVQDLRVLAEYMVEDSTDLTDVE